MPLRVDYDLGAIRLKLADLASRAPTLWRYRELLPLEEGDEVALGEGFTPLLAVGENVWVKDEARNPTGSFKARGMSVAVTMAGGYASDVEAIVTIHANTIRMAAACAVSRAASRVAVR
jgi:threonine synthase